MTLNSASSTARQTVTLKLKLDKMAVETGFVILTSPQPSVVAQRVPGYYKIRENEIVEEQMDLPSNQCYKLILLDSFGDGFCCDMGGGSGELYLGTDTGYYTGRVLVEVKGSFEYDSSGEFCLDASSMIVGTDEGKSAVVNSPSGSSSSSGSDSSSSVSSSNNVSSESNSNGSSSSNSNQGSSSNSGSGWSGPATSAAFEYCNKFCVDNAKALNCGSYTCYHSGASATDSQGSGGSGNSGSGGGSSDKDEFDPHGHASNPDEYFLTVQFKFDDHPQDVSWVLYDLTANEVRMFVDFDVYKEEDFANQKLEVVVNVEGPEAGEKQYAFTVYDKASDGLCCDNGKGWYKLFLGNVEDNMKLLGDADYEFSSSYYFTLFEEEEGDMTMNNSSAQDEESTSDPTKPPTVSPTAKPSDKPTPGPTARPSVSPTQSPSHSPTTPKPTFPWEVKRSELMEEIGARWNTASVTPPDGKFNDVGGDPRSFDFTADLQRSDGSSSFRIWAMLSALLLACFALL
jgi:hypothetical protein